MQIRVETRRRREIGAAPDQVFALLADVPDSVAHFPDVLELVSEQGGYTWHMKPERIGPVRVQTIYACRYRIDRERRSVLWEPIAGIGNALVRGAWEIAPADPGTRLTLRTEFDLELDVPRLLRGAAQPIVQSKLERLLDTYLDNLVRTFKGGIGRLRDWR